MQILYRVYKGLEVEGIIGLRDILGLGLLGRPVDLKEPYTPLEVKRYKKLRYKASYWSIMVTLGRVRRLGSMV